MIHPLVCTLCILLVAPAMVLAEQPGFNVGLASTLLDQNKYHQAIEAGGMHGERLSRLQAARIHDARSSGADATALQLYEDYFLYFPYGRGPDWKNFGFVAMDYAKFLEKNADVGAGTIGAENVAAAALYAQFDEYFAQRFDPVNKNACRVRVEQLVRDYPRSLFCIPAMHLFTNREHNNMLRNEQFVAYHDKIVASTPSSRNRLLLRIAQITQLTSGGLPRARAALQMAQESDIPWERRYYLLLAAESFPGSTAELDSSKLFREFLTKYPQAPECGRARAGYMRRLLSRKSPVAALQILRELEVENPDGDSAESLFAISQGFFREEAFERSLDLLQEIDRRFPSATIRARAQIGMGEVYEKLADEKRMVAAYQTAISLPREQTATNLMDASDTHNRAIEFLGNHFMQKRAFNEAQKYWQQWQPRSWCGTCSQSMIDRKQRNLALCQLHLGHADDAVAGLLEGSQHESLMPDLNSLLLVRIYELAGQLDDLARICEARVGSRLTELNAHDYWKTKPERERLELIPESRTLVMISITKTSGFDAAKATCLKYPERGNTELWDFPAPKQGCLPKPMIEPLRTKRLRDLEHPKQGALSESMMESSNADQVEAAKSDMRTLLLVAAALLLTVTGSLVFVARLRTRARPVTVRSGKR